MYSSRIRHAMMAFALGALLVLAYYRQMELAAVAGFLFFFVLWSHFKHSSILMASKYFKNGNHEKAMYYLNEVPNPDKLARNRRGYYEFMLANIALKEEDYATAEHHFQIASRFPLGGKNEKSFVLIHLANLALRNKDAERALVYTARAKELAQTSRANDLIKRIEHEVEKISRQSGVRSPEPNDQEEQ